VGVLPTIAVLLLIVLILLSSSSTNLQLLAVKIFVTLVKGP
jgi:hypothetical protein